MLFTTHLLVGAAIGKATGNPVGGFAVGYLSHHLLDYVPHYDPGSLFYKEEKEPDTQWQPFTYFMAIADVALGMGIITIVALNSPEATNIIAGALGGVLPDLLDNVPAVKDLFRKTKFGTSFHSFHEKLHNTFGTENLFIGLMMQIILSGVMLIYIAQGAI